MLVLTRRPSESIIIANNIKITVVSVGPGRVKLGIEAPPNVRVDRQEIHDKIEQSADVLSALTTGEAGSANAENTLVGAGPDTAMIVSTAPAATPTGTVPVGTPQPTANPTPPPGSLGGKLSRYRFPRKPR
ncbi:MAG: carbon storage regulator [Planctomycetes bacterium]|nr:carbon storage regulator [Planctomycetota bacterium]